MALGSTPDRYVSSRHFACFPAAIVDVRNCRFGSQVAADFKDQIGKALGGDLSRFSAYPIGPKHKFHDPEASKEGRVNITIEPFERESVGFISSSVGLSVYNLIGKEDQAREYTVGELGEVFTTIRESATGEPQKQVLFERNQYSSGDIELKFPITENGLGELDWITANAFPVLGSIFSDTGFDHLAKQVRTINWLRRTISDPDNADYSNQVGNLLRVTPGISARIQENFGIESRLSQDVDRLASGFQDQLEQIISVHRVTVSSWLDSINNREETYRLLQNI